MSKLYHFCPFLLLLGAYSASAAMPVDWLAPVNGDWDNPSAWVGGRVPGMIDDVPTLGLVGPYLVRASSVSSYGYLRIENTQAVLDIVGGAQTTQLGISNDGLIRIGDPLGAGDSSMRFSQDSEIIGTGTVELISRDSTDDALLLSFFGTLTHGPFHTISGAGQLFVISMINAGQIVATESRGLELFGAITQINEGRIGAWDGKLILGQFLQINGGELFTQGEGQVLVDGDGVGLRDVVIDGSIFHGTNSGTLLLAGDIENNGVINFQSQSVDQQLNIVLEPGAFIAGDGVITILGGDNQENARLTLGDNNMATIGAGQVIRGGGMIDIGSPALLTLDGQITSIPGEIPLEIKGGIRGEGELIANEVDILLAHNSALDGIRISTPNAAVRVDAGTVTLRDVVNDGTIRLEENNALLRLEETFVNNGRVVLDGRNTDGRTRVQTRTVTAIGGDGTFELITNDGVSALFEVDFQTTTLGSGQVIMGSGSVTASGLSMLINHGRIVATDPAMPLTLRGSHQRVDDGEYRAQEGDLLLTGSVFESPRFTTSAEREVLVQSATIRNLDNLGTMRFLSGGNSRGILSGESFNNGQIILEPFSEMNIESESSLGGVGLILMSNQSEFNVGTTYSTPTVIGPGQEIRGAGKVLGSMRLDGKLIADRPGEELLLDGWITFGTGELIAESSTMRLGSGTRLTNGVLRTGSGGRFVVDSVLEFNDLENTGLLEVESRGAIRIESDVLNSGMIRLIGSEYADYVSMMEFDFQSTLNGDGIVELLLSSEDRIGSAVIRSIIGKSGRIGSEQTVRGAGQIIGSLVVEGAIEPLPPHNVFQVTDLQLEEGAQLRLSLGGSADGQFGNIKLFPTGHIEIDGDLVVTLQGGYVPRFGDSWEFISSVSSRIPGSYHGQFASVQFPEPREGTHYLLRYEDDGVRVVLTCVSDLDGDFAVNYADISIFIQYMIARNPLADVNGDGAFNYFDISSYLTVFAQGCSE